jgi:hypothetical protein
MTAVIPFVLVADTLTSPGCPVAPVVVTLLSEIRALVVESTELKATAPAPATPTPTRPPPIATEAAAASTLIVDLDTFSFVVVGSYVRM